MAPSYLNKTFWSYPWFFPFSTLSLPHSNLLSASVGWTSQIYLHFHSTDEPGLVNCNNLQEKPLFPASLMSTPLDNNYCPITPFHMFVEAGRCPLKAKQKPSLAYMVTIVPISCLYSSPQQTWIWLCLLMLESLPNAYHWWKQTWKQQYNEK